jgi:hypothetical protein
LIGTSRHIDRYRHLPGEDPESTDVVPVLVGHQDAGQPVHAFADRFEALRQLLKGKAIVN